MTKLTMAVVTAVSVTMVLCSVHADSDHEFSIVRGSGEQAFAPVTDEEFDAVVLSQGTSTNGFINREMQAKTLAALMAIRTKFPEIANIHPMPSTALDSLLIGLTPQGQQIIEQKVKPRNDSFMDEPIVGGTGIRALDQLNAKYEATTVTTFISTKTLMIRFKNSLDIPVLSKIYAAVPEVHSAGGDTVISISAGNKLHLKRNTNVWLFAFNRCWSDGFELCSSNRYSFISYRPNTKAVIKTGEYMGSLSVEEMWKKAQGGEK